MVLSVQHRVGKVGFIVCPPLSGGRIQRQFGNMCNESGRIMKSALNNLMLGGFWEDRNCTSTMYRRWEGEEWLARVQIIISNFKSFFAGICNRFLTNTLTNTLTNQISGSIAVSGNFGCRNDCFKSVNPDFV